ncbi:hypothetical protein M758_2G111600 [Ceratodon purpureus]|nr:hypothetical protein M758_2G111600 [Ceratodon purpureus]
MAASALGVISVPSSGVASSLPSNTKPSSKLVLTRGFRTRAGRARTAITAAYQVTLITPEGDKVVHVSKDECILDAAEKQGVVLPHNCRSGACSSCVGLLKSGTVNQDDQTFLDEAQLEAGFALMCTAYPTSDCVIETHKEDQFY